jgi:signal transduction histidine kinase
MLHEFLTANRNELIDRCRLKVVLRDGPLGHPALEHGVPLFLDQLVKTLRVERTAEPLESRKVSGPEGGGNRTTSEIGETATLHGRELLKHGFTVDQVVHDYGDVCQAITDLAFERDAHIEIDEFRTLNRCLDNAIADAVTEFSYQRETAALDKAELTLNERLGSLAHELRNHINTATLAVTAIKAGNVGWSGATGAVLDRSLIALRSLMDRSLAEVRVTAGMPAPHKLHSLANFIAEVKSSTALEAQARGCKFTVSSVDPELAVDVHRDQLFSAVGNLLQNAFKFTHPNSEVSLNAYAAGDRILIDVHDTCGGLPPGIAEQLFLPFVQAGTDRSGLGLGLSICRRGVAANNGVLSVRDIPGTGCVFTISLPRHRLSATELTAQ